MLDACIDVSDAQGPPRRPIDWALVRGAGIRVAFVKALEGTGSSYPTWRDQSAGARAAGITVVPYFFLRPVDPATAVARFATAAGLATGVPFALDWEGRASQTCSPQVAEAIGIGLGEVTNRLPVGYWGIAGSTPAQPTTVMQTWDRWVPRYPQVPQPPDLAALGPSSAAKRPAGALFWQYTSAGVVSGIDGPVDRSAWCGTADELAAWVATGARPAP